MTALKASDVDAFIARPDATRPIVLVYGNDAGLVSERVEALLRASVDDPKDAMAVVRLDGEAVASDPALLVDEAQSIPLFGGRRAVWVRVGGRANVVPALEVLAQTPLRDTRVIFEAGDLKKSAPLRTFCERAANIVAAPCFADGVKDLERLVDDEMRDAGLKIDRPTRAMLVALLGGDRRASRNELRKLTAYMHGREQVAPEDILAVVSDAAGFAMDTVADAAFAGRVADVEIEFTRVLTSGTSAGSVISAALRQAVSLHKMRLAVDGGTALADAMRGVFFRRQETIGAALRTWTASRLAVALADLAAAAFAIRRNTDLGEAVARRALLTIAMRARKRD